jgi:hypothetical protein
MEKNGPNSSNFYDKFPIGSTKYKKEPVLRINFHIWFIAKIWLNFCTVTTQKFE